MADQKWSVLKTSWQYLNQIGFVDKYFHSPTGPDYLKLILDIACKQS